MRLTWINVVITALATVSTIGPAAAAAFAPALAQETTPNVVFIGYGDVGPYRRGELRGKP